MKILSFGEMLFDGYENNYVIGGAAFNFATHIVASGDEDYVYTTVGNDKLGKKALEIADKFHVNKKYLSMSDQYPTGVSNIVLDKDGVPTFDLVRNVGYDHIKYIPLEEKFDAISFVSLALRDESEDSLDTLKKLLANNKFKHIYCDPNLRAPYIKDKIVRFCLETPDIIKLNEDEVAYIRDNIINEKLDNESFAKRLNELYPNIKLVLMTFGPNGSIVYYQNKFYKCPSVKTEVVSTVGAGDSFGATFLSSFLHGEDIDTCLKKASIRSAFVVSRKEATPDI